MGLRRAALEARNMGIAYMNARASRVEGKRVVEDVRKHLVGAKFEERTSSSALQRVTCKRTDCNWGLACVVQVGSILQRLG